MRRPSAVTLVEVGPRDGLQNESTVLPVDVKAEFVRRLVAAGLPVVSLAEDLAAVVGSLLAVFAPVMGLAFFTLLAWFAWKGVMKLRRIDCITS